MKATDIEQNLLSRTLPGLLPTDEGWVLPHYDGWSIANVPATAAALLDAELPGALPPLPRKVWAEWRPGLRRVVLIVLDALGYRMLQRRWAAGEGRIFAEIGQAGRLIPLTSIFPSTTAAALVSLSTGCSPAEHGWLAYHMYLRELGVAANAIMLCPIWNRQRDQLVDWGLEPDNLLNVPSLAGRLADQGIATVALFAAFFGGSGFTKMLYRGVETLRGHRLASDLWGHLRHLLADLRGRRAMITVYWSGLDTLAHAYGPNTELWDTEFRTVSHLLEHEFLARLPAQDREGTLLLITADHGQLHIPAEHIVTVKDEPALGQHLLVPVVGESRAAFVYPRPGREQAIRDYLAEKFPGWFVVLDSVEALEAGLMGAPISDETYARAGELLVLPRANRALQPTTPNVALLGRHGGLSEDEMLVPLIGTRLEALP